MLEMEVPNLEELHLSQQTVHPPPNIPIRKTGQDGAQILTQQQVQGQQSMKEGGGKMTGLFPTFPMYNPMVNNDYLMGQFQQQYQLNGGQNPHGMNAMETAGGDHMEKRLVNSNFSGLSEMSESSVELLKTIIQHPSSEGMLGGQERVIPGPNPGHFHQHYQQQPQQLHQQYQQQFPFGFDPKKRKVDLPQRAPGDDKKQRHLIRTNESNFMEVLERNCMDSSMEDIIQAMKCLENGTPIYGSPQVQKEFATLQSVVCDKTKRVDRFHKKKASKELKDMIASPFKSLKKKTVHSSGQGCTLVVVTKRCTKHNKHCKTIDHSPHDFIVTREPVTRSNFGKWVNSFMKSDGLLVSK